VVECREQLDLDAYWNLDFDGSLLPAGEMPTLLYARSAWPRLKDAQEQWRLETDAMKERSRHKPQRRPHRGGVRT
jgi:hypothetical protein